MPRDITGAVSVRLYFLLISSKRRFRRLIRISYIVGIDRTSLYVLGEKSCFFIFTVSLARVISLSNRTERKVDE